MRTITERQRRSLLCRRHHLAGTATGPEEATRSVIALHATDPASVYLSVLARSSATALTDVAEAMYDRRSLVRWLGMRRTLFLVPYDDVPLVQAAVSSDVAAALRTRLINQIARNGTEPRIDGDAAAGSTPSQTEWSRRCTPAAARAAPNWGRTCRVCAPRSSPAHPPTAHRR